VAARPSFGVLLPKAYLVWRGETASALAGTYRLGWAEGLTLDNSGRRQPDGFYPDDQLNSHFELARRCTQTDCPEEEGGYVTSDFAWRSGFRGAAASAQARLDAVTLSATGFGSYQDRAVYQYELFDRARCDDPRSSGSECNAPPIYVEGGESERFIYSSLPALVQELSGGGHLGLQWGGARLGLTGYAAQPIWQVAGAELDFQEWARYPFNGPFGALGADAAYSAGAWRVALEAARSFDSLPRAPTGGGGSGGGGFGAIQRTTFSREKQQVDLSLRYYGRDYVNPHGSPYAESDEYQGQRARNEAGARIGYFGALAPGYSARADLDVWAWPEDGVVQGSAGTAHLTAYARLDAQPWRTWGFAVAGDYRNKDLGESGRGGCYSEPNETIGGVQQPCRGERYQATGRVRFSPREAVTAWVEYSHRLVDARGDVSSLRQDGIVRLDAAWRPVEQLRLRLHARYLDEALAVAGATGTEDSLWTWVDLGWTGGRWLTASVRYGLYAALSPSSRSTPPAQEHRFRLELESRF
jgi:hypothetical protein